MRGGIVDFWPMTSPWPVRLEFFGNELESLRYFDPLTQISREEIQAITVPPGGEIGLLKKEKSSATASLLEYLPSAQYFCCANRNCWTPRQPVTNPRRRPAIRFLSRGGNSRRKCRAREMAALSVSQVENTFIEDVIVDGTRLENPEALDFQGLEVFRPIGERRPEPHIAEAQRKEFFAQLHRWLRQGYRCAPLLQQRRRTAAFRGNLEGIRPGPARRPAHPSWRALARLSV